MPIYEYVCRECGEEFELLVINKSEEIKCPKCGSPKLEQQVSGFASVSSSGGSGASNCAPSGG